MIRKYITGLACCLLPLLAAAQLRYDVVVYGGTPGGITAAIQVARMGKTVALIETTAHIGGIMTNGLGVTDIDSQQAFQNSVAVGGLALEYYRRIAKVYGREKEFEEAWRTRTKKHALWSHEPGVGEKVLMDWLAAHQVKVFTRSRLVEKRNAVSKKGTTITRIRMENGKTFSAGIFIDATYEGDLLAAAGISTIIGREANAQYNETLNGIRGETTHAQFQVKVDPYKIPGNPQSGLIPTIQPGGIGTPGAADKHLQAYCFRAVLTPEPANRVPFRKPPGYDRNTYEIYVRYLEAGGHLLWPWVSVPNKKSDLGAWHDLSHNLYGMNVDYPGGNYATRKRVYDEHRFFTEGLFYFLANDTAVGRLAPDLQKEWASWGLAKDEFTDNGNWPHQFYVRDARRMVSDYVITEHHILKPDPVPVEDPVGVAFWPPDVHSVRRIVKDGYAYNEGFVFEPAGNWRPLPVAYRALVPRSRECTNLLTPTCPSSSHIAYGAIRLEWTFMVLGQSAATAAVMALDEGKSVQEVDYARLRAKLLEQGQVLSLDE